jgi:hypothetical protein
VAWAVEVAFDLAQRCTELIPYLGEPESAVRALRPITEALTISMLLAVDADDSGTGGLFPEAEQDTASLIGRRVPLERIFSAERRGHAQLAEHFLQACRSLVPGPDQAAEMERVSRILFDAHNLFAERTTEFFLVEERRWLVSAAARRDEIVREVLAHKDIDTGGASQELGYDLRSCYHLALIVQDETATPSDSLRLPRTATALLRQIGADAQIVMPVNRTEVWAWGAFRESPQDHALADPDHPALLVAVGRARRGIDGFRASHHDAHATAQLTALLPHHNSRGRLLHYDDVRLTTLLAADRDRAVGFMRDELGALYHTGQATRDLRETLRTYLECNCSPQDASRRLHVAKNTVVYRVKRAEELLGRNAKTHQFELWAALHLAAIIEP